MERYASGDDRAFATLHRGLYPRLFGYLARMSGSPVLAADLVQETMLRVHRARATFAEGAEVVPWVYAIARNVHHGHARAARVRAALPLLDVEVPDEGTDVESAAIAAEGAAVVARALAGLPASQREAFVLLRWEGLSVEQAAGVVGTTPAALKLRAFRAYEALRAALGVPERRMAHGGGQRRCALEMALQLA